MINIFNKAIDDTIYHFFNGYCPEEKEIIEFDDYYLIIRPK